jgi:hypothetical protein
MPVGTRWRAKLLTLKVVICTAARRCCQRTFRDWGGHGKQARLGWSLNALEDVRSEEDREKEESEEGV